MFKPANLELYITAYKEYEILVWCLQIKQNQGYKHLFTML